jgi:hypothetical protein
MGRRYGLADIRGGGAAAMIRKGDTFTFKPQYRDAGDENFTFVARSDQDGGRFDYSVLEHKPWRIWPVMRASIDMVETINESQS